MRRVDQGSPVPRTKEHLDPEPMPMLARHPAPLPAPLPEPLPEPQRLAVHPAADEDPLPATQLGGSRATEAAPPTDELLMAQIAKGDRQAFAALLDRHLARTVALARRTLGRLGDTDAEDIAQEAFTRLWTRAASWQGAQTGAKFTTWFHRVVVNLCIDHARRKRPEPLAEDWDAADDGPGADLRLVERATARQVQAAINALPERQRAALHLCWFDHRSNVEAAEILGVGVKALESLLVRARRTLRQSLKEVYDDQKE